MGNSSCEFRTNWQNSSLKHAHSNFNLSAARAAGAIIATTEDLAKWARALFFGKVLAPAEFERMTKVVCMQPGEDCQAGETAPAI